MDEVILFDLGGVIFYDFFSGGDEEFVKALALPKEKIFEAYVKTDLTEYSEGKIDDNERWLMFVKELGLPKTKLQTCIGAFYKGYKPINEMIGLIKQLKMNHPNLSLGVLSDQPEGIATYLRKNYQYIFELFDKDLVLISTEVGLSKQAENLEFYKEALKRAKVSAAEVMLVDNSQSNMKNAASFGMQGFFFDIENVSINSLVEKLKKKVGKWLS